MRITIDIKESCVYKYGTIVLAQLSPDPDMVPQIALPGFKYSVQNNEPTFVINRSFGDSRDVQLNPESTVDKKGVTHEQTNGIEGEGGVKTDSGEKLGATDKSGGKEESDGKGIRESSDIPTKETPVEKSEGRKFTAGVY